MSTSMFSEATDAPALEQEAHPYRAMSRAAMMTLVFGLLATLGLLVPLLLVFSLFGLICWCLAMVNLRRYPNELSGRPVAMAGGFLCFLLLVGGISFHSFVYATEVPEGYVRVPFRVLQAEENSPLPVPEKAAELDGMRIFIKGYIHPDAGMAPVQQFVLVPDMGTCCFGGQPALTDMIEVTLQENQRVRYSTRKRKLAGVLKVDSRLKPVDGLKGVYYQLLVDEVIR